MVQDSCTTGGKPCRRRHLISERIVTGQTKIGHENTDFFLQTRQKGERAWSSDLVLPSDLPKVELEFLWREDRSPQAAPGRERYKDNQRHDKRKERPSSGSSV